MRDYALYRGEELLCIGTIKELAEYHGVSINTIMFYSTPSWRKRREGSERGNYLEVIRLEDEE